MTPIEEIAKERARQIEVEGYSTANDDNYNTQLRMAAIGHILKSCGYHTDAGSFFPTTWNIESLLKEKSDRRRLVVAAALLVAEIERMDRMGYIK